MNNGIKQEKNTTVSLRRAATVRSGLEEWRTRRTIWGHGTGDDGASGFE
jgi:hypothetical protein